MIMFLVYHRQSGFSNETNEAQAERNGRKSCYISYGIAPPRRLE